MTSLCTGATLPSGGLTERATGAVLAQYRLVVEQRIGVRLPMTYLLQGLTEVVRVDGVLLGGFSVIRRGPFRSLAQLPIDVRRRCEAELFVPGRRCIEVNGLFLTPGLARPVAAGFWKSLSQVVALSAATDALISYSADNLRLRRLYGVLRGRRVYEGLVHQLEGMRCADVECVEVVSTSQLLKSLVRFHGGAQ